MQRSSQRVYIIWMAQGRRQITGICTSADADDSLDRKRARTAYDDVLDVIDWHAHMRKCDSGSA